MVAEVPQPLAFRVILLLLAHASSHLCGVICLLPLGLGVLQKSRSDESLRTTAGVRKQLELLWYTTACEASTNSLGLSSQEI